MAEAINKDFVWLKIARRKSLCCLSVYKYSVKTAIGQGITSVLRTFVAKEGTYCIQQKNPCPGKHDAKTIVLGDVEGV